MGFAIAVNIIWILWSLYVFVTGFGRFGDPHVHAYVYFFFIGTGLVLLGSTWLKIMHFRGRATRLVQFGFYLWLAGFLMFVLCIFFGAGLSNAQFVRAHVIFSHVKFMAFFVGMPLSIYVDLLIIARLADGKRKEPRDENSRDARMKQAIK